MARVSEAAGELSYILILDEYDCGQRTSRNLNLAHTSRDGKLSVTQGSGRPENVIPGTAGNNYWQYACGSLAAARNIPEGTDPILFIRESLRKISEERLIDAMDVFVRRDQDKLSLSESQRILIAFREISAQGDDQKLIDSENERAGLFIAIRSNAPSRAVWSELTNNLGLEN